MNHTYILGLSAFYHDSAACLVRDGEIVAAAQEERFTRKKHDPNFPTNAINFCLKQAGIESSDLKYVAFYDKPWIKFERLLETYLAFAPFGFASFLKAMPLWIKEKLWMGDVIKNELGYEGDLIYPEHHQSHAASAFYPSPFQSAAVLTIDGVGEWATASWGVGNGNQLELKSELRFPHSLGLLYSAFTYYTGFKVNSGEYKVMGLAPYGEPRYVDLILSHLLDLREDGSFRMDMSYFNYCQGLTMTSEKFHKLFGGPPRTSETRLSQREMDLARSVQEVTEIVMLKMARHVRKETGERNLCLAGGVALNCVANGKIHQEKIFDRIWIQPAAGDAGGALGAAMFGWHQVLNNPRKANAKRDSQYGSYLGPQFKPEEIEVALNSVGAVYHRILASNGVGLKSGSNGHSAGGTSASSNGCSKDCALVELVAKEINEGKVIGWFSGRMEFGPRALGSRSIIGDPRKRDMQSTMNLKIKFRESFRPFAPSCLREDVTDYFDYDDESPYMLMVAPVKKERRLQMTAEQEKLFGIEKLNVPRSDIPAVTHVDYSARIQTVEGGIHPRYYDLIKKFKDLSGYGVVINTSFNVRGEPIVCTPQDAFRCFMRTEIDVLVIDDYVLYKGEQTPLEKDSDWQKEFELD